MHRLSDEGRVVTGSLEEGAEAISPLRQSSWLLHTLKLLVMSALAKYQLSIAGI